MGKRKAKDLNKDRPTSSDSTTTTRPSTSPSPPPPPPSVTSSPPPLPPPKPDFIPPPDVSPEELLERFKTIAELTEILPYLLGTSMTILVLSWLYNQYNSKLFNFLHSLLTRTLNLIEYILKNLGIIIYYLDIIFIFLIILAGFLTYATYKYHTSQTFRSYLTPIYQHLLLPLLSHLSSNPKLANFLLSTLLYSPLLILYKYLPNYLNYPIYLYALVRIFLQFKFPDRTEFELFLILPYAIYLLIRWSIKVGLKAFLIHLMTFIGLRGSDGNSNGNGKNWFETKEEKEGRKEREKEELKMREMERRKEEIRLQREKEELAKEEKEKAGGGEEEGEDWRKEYMYTEEMEENRKEMERLRRKLDEVGQDLDPEEEEGEEEDQEEESAEEEEKDEVEEREMTEEEKALVEAFRKKVQSYRNDWKV